MTKEDKQALEDAAKAARTKADEAHDAAAAADGADEALNKAAEEAEEAAGEAQALVDAATVAPEEDPENPEAPAESEQDIDFEKELQALGGTERPAGGKPGKPLTALEKAERALHFNAEQVKKLGGDPTKVIKPAAPVAPVEAPAPAADSPYATKDDLAEAEAAKYARTEAERKVILYHYRHSIKPSGNIISDIENAYMLAHKGRITRSFDEIRRGAAVRVAPGTPPGRKPPATGSKAPTLSPAEEAILKRRGFTKQADGSFEGKHYRTFFDKDKKSWVTEAKLK